MQLTIGIDGLGLAGFLVDGPICGVKRKTLILDSQQRIYPGVGRQCHESGESGVRKSISRVRFHVGLGFLS